MVAARGVACGHGALEAKDSGLRRGRRARQLDIELDGLDLFARYRAGRRDEPIGFASRGKVAWIEERLKLIRPKRDAAFELYDLRYDPGEERDLASGQREAVATMRANLEEWLERVGVE